MQYVRRKVIVHAALGLWEYDMAAVLGAACAACVNHGSAVAVFLWLSYVGSVDARSRRAQPTLQHDALGPSLILSLKCRSGVPNS